MCDGSYNKAKELILIRGGSETMEPQLRGCEGKSLVMRTYNYSQKVDYIFKKDQPKGQCPLAPVIGRHWAVDEFDSV